MTFETAFSVLVGLDRAFLNDLLREKRLNREEIRLMLLNEYWNKMQCNKFYNHSIRFELFDFSVSSNAKTAIELFQKALCFLKFKVEINGDMTPETIANGNSASFQFPRVLLNTFRGYQFVYLTQLNPRNGTQEKLIISQLSKL